MIDSPKLLANLKVQLKLLEADLRARAEDAEHPWGASLRAEYATATARERTGLAWITWRDGQVAQAAVAWIIASVFIRFAEDNDLLEGVTVDGMRESLPWFAGPGDRIERGVENQQAFYTANPTAAGPDWLRHAFRALASLPSGRALVDPDHSLVWTAPISGEAADSLLKFWRSTDASGTIVHDFTSPTLDTRFLGDLYQDLSEFAKDQYALLQTPVFVEEFILDQALTPAIAEFGLDGLKLIDPTCGSGHFLLGAFDRLVAAWADQAPALDARARVANALAAVHGVDLNPFAVAIARFRLTVAALRAAEDRSLVAAPDYRLKLAIGDSLLASQASSVKLFEGENDKDEFEYANEDVTEYVGILETNQYHVVVGNPPYITVKDAALNKQYRRLYKSAFRQYQLSAPFFELFFSLARRGDALQGGGYIGQITSNGFMTQEFGAKLVEGFIAGHDLLNPVDLSLIIDASGAPIPGHGTPTVIIIGRKQRPSSSSVRTSINLRGEPSAPKDGSTGAVWAEIVDSLGSAPFDGAFTAVRMLDRAGFNTHPWTLGNPAETALKEDLEGDQRTLIGIKPVLGYTGQTNIDDAFLIHRRTLERHNIELDLIRDFVTGENVRDFQINTSESALFPYRNGELVPIEAIPATRQWLWPLRSLMWSRATFSKATYKTEGRPWWGWHQVAHRRVNRAYTITFPSVATHAHFSLDRERRIFNRHAPFIQLPAAATEDEHLELLGVLNSSTACFWLKQVSHNKGGPGGGSSKDEKWRDFYEFTGTKLQGFPLPAALPVARGRLLDQLAQEESSQSPRAAISVARTSNGDLAAEIESARTEWKLLRSRMVFAQEELDWEVYRLYGLIDEDLTFGGDLDRLTIGARAFEIALARRVATGDLKTRWFSEFAETQITEAPAAWPDDYRELVERRLEAIASNPAVRLLEQPDFKRTWKVGPYDTQLADALTDALLDHLETRTLWVDANGRPVTRSVNELADLVKSEEWFRQLATLASGSQDVDLRALVGTLLADEAVPYLAALRYKPASLEKFRTWEHTWDLQRAEDRGEKVEVPVPPKYGKEDFRKDTYWKARGKLDVPKERFISYPGTSVANDSSARYGWAGWNHADRAQALARLAMELVQLGAPGDDLSPLLAGLLELQPWLDQWHAERDASTNVSPADAIRGLTDSLLTQFQLSRDTVSAWQPPTATRGRAANSKGSK